MNESQMTRLDIMEDLSKSVPDKKPSTNCGYGYYGRLPGEAHLVFPKTIESGAVSFSVRREDDAMYLSITYESGGLDADTRFYSSASIEYYQEFKAFPKWEHYYDTEMQLNAVEARI